MILNLTVLVFFDGATVSMDPPSSPDLIQPSATSDAPEASSAGFEPSPDPTTVETTTQMSLAQLLELILQTIDDDPVSSHLLVHCISGNPLIFLRPCPSVLSPQHRNLVLMCFAR